MPCAPPGVKGLDDDDDDDDMSREYVLTFKYCQGKFLLIPLLVFCYDGIGRDWWIVCQKTSGTEQRM